VDSDAGELLSPCLYRIEHRNRLAIAQPDDQVCVLTEVVEYSLGWAVLAGERSLDFRRLV
jgi:hypothetical protein